METDNVSKRGTFVAPIQILGILASVHFFLLNKNVVFQLSRRNLRKIPISLHTPVLR